MSHQIVVVRDHLSSLLNTTTDSKILVDLKSFNSVLNELFSNYDLLLPIVTEYDFEHVQSNGLRLFLSIIEKYCHLLCKQLSNQANFPAREIRIGTMLNIISSLMVDICIKQNVTCVDFVERILAIDDNCYESLIETNWFFIPQHIMNYFVPITAIMTMFRLQSWRKLFRWNWQVKLLAEQSTDFNINDFIDIWSVCDLDIVIKSDIAKFPCDLLKFVDLTVNSVTQITESGQLVKSNSTNTINCMVTQHGSDDRFNGRVVFLHGSGFVATHAKAHQGFARQMAREMPGVLVITPDYRFAPDHKYPEPLQDVVDVYLALMGIIKSNRDS